MHFKDYCNKIFNKPSNRNYFCKTITYDYFNKLSKNLNFSQSKWNKLKKKWLIETIVIYGKKEQIDDLENYLTE